MQVITITKNIVGDNRGKVILKNISYLFAPSIFAASNSDWLIELNPDKNINILYPINFQTETIMTAGIAKFES